MTMMWTKGFPNFSETSGELLTYLVNRYRQNYWHVQPFFLSFRIHMSSHFLFQASVASLDFNNSQKKSFILRRMASLTTIKEAIKMTKLHKWKGLNFFRRPKVAHIEPYLWKYNLSKSVRCTSSIIFMIASRQYAPLCVYASVVSVQQCDLCVSYDHHCALMRE